jgi:hypothetical protein
VLALFLALPILNFGAISAGNQLHRLESGKVTPDKFDFAALRWDFGDAGKRALARLAKDPNAHIAELAQAALAQQNHGPVGEFDYWKGLGELVFVDVADAHLRQSMRDYLIEHHGCSVRCVMSVAGTYADGSPHIILLEGYQLTHFHVAEGGALQMGPARARPAACDRTSRPTADADAKAAQAKQEAECAAAELQDVAPQAPPSVMQAGKTPKVEIKPYVGRQVYVDGKPFGEPFAD